MRKLSGPKPAWRGRSGITLIETTIMLTVAAILTAALAPVGKRTIDMSRFARARADLQAINESILAFVDSTGLHSFSVDGTSLGPRVQLLVSDGDIPTEAAGAGNAAWLAPVDSATGTVDFLERHLVTNDPRGTSAYAYKVPSTISGKGWRGAYLSGPVSSDPWGSRYMVNVKFMVAPSKWGPFYDVSAYSAGPDEIVDTEFAADGAVPRNDDLLQIVFRHPLAAEKTHGKPDKPGKPGKPGDDDDDDEKDHGKDKDKDKGKDKH